MIHKLMYKVSHVSVILKLDRNNQKKWRMQFLKDDVIY